MAQTLSYIVTGLAITSVVRDNVLPAEGEGIASPVGRDLRLVTTTGDLDMANGDLIIVNSLDGIRQEITQRLQFFENDWFLDLQAGLPYFEQILDKLTDINLIKRLYQDEIEATPGVKTVKAIEARLDNTTRNLYIDFTCDTDLGELSLSNFLALQTTEI